MKKTKGSKQEELVRAYYADNLYVQQYIDMIKEKYGGLAWAPSSSSSLPVLTYPKIEFVEGGLNYVGQFTDADNAQFYAKSLIGLVLKVPYSFSFTFPYSPLGGQNNWVIGLGTVFQNYNWVIPPGGTTSILTDLVPAVLPGTNILVCSNFSRVVYNINGGNVTNSGLPITSGILPGNYYLGPYLTGASKIYTFRELVPDKIEFGYNGTYYMLTDKLPAMNGADKSVTIYNNTAPGVCKFWIDMVASP